MLVLKEKRRPVKGAYFFSVLIRVPYETLRIIR